MTLTNRIKNSESQKLTLQSQNDALKRINDELSKQVKAEREAKQKATEQGEAMQRQLRPPTSKTRVSSSHQDAV